MREAIDVAVDQFSDHGAFERRDDRTFAQVTTPFEATASVLGGDGGVRIRLVVEFESLSGAVAEAVPEVVEAGWFETFERRVSDATTVTAADDDPTPQVTRGAETVTVDVSFDAASDRAAADAKAVVDFLEATWVQGLVPGYEYDEPAASLLTRARGQS
jgi:hypothetical protein